MIVLHRTALGATVSDRLVFDGTSYFSDTINALLLAGVEEPTPGEFGLSQNHPNPFNLSTEMTFSVDAHERSQLEVFSLLGERVATLVNRMLGYGTPYHVTFHADQWPAGIYFYRLQSGERVAVRNMLLLK
jgi:hypothetical protein